MIEFIKNLFKKKPILHYEIHYNKVELQEKSGSILDRLHLYKHDEAMKDVMMLIQIAKNIAVLDVASHRGEKDILRAQIRADVFSELQNHFEREVNKKTLESKEGKKPITGTVNMFRRTTNQAGSAV